MFRALIDMDLFVKSGDLLTRLVEPMAGRTPQQRRKARMLAFILLSALVLDSLVIASSLLTGLATDPTRMIINVITFVALLGLYVVNRSLHYAISTALLIALPFGAVLGIVFLTEPPSTVLVTVFVYLNLAVLLSSLVFSIRWTIGVAGANVALTVLMLVIVLPDVDHEAMFGVIWLNVIMSLLIVIAGLARSYDQQQLDRQTHELRQSEARYRQLFEAISDPVCVHEDGAIVDVNPAFEAMFRRSREAVLGQPTTCYVVPGSQQPVAAPTFRSQTGLFAAQVFRDDGVVIPVELSAREYSQDGRQMGITTVRDMTAHKEAEQALESERNLLRTVIDNIPFPIYVKDRDYRRVLGNKVFFDAWVDVDAIGKTDHELGVPDADQYREEEQTLFASGKPLLNKTVYMPLGPGNVGDPTWLLVTKVPLRDADGNITGLVGINRDVTEQRRTRLQLEAERTLLRTVVDNLPDQVYAKDRDHRFVLVNAATQSWWAPYGDMMGKTDHELGIPNANDYQDGEETLFTSGDSVLNEAMYMPPGTGDVDGPTWLLVTKVPLRDADGNVTGMVGINRDVTEQRRTQLQLEEERTLLRTVIDNLPDQVFAKDRDHRFVLTNQTMQEHWQRDLIGLADADIMPDELAAAHNAREQAIFTTGEPLSNKEIEVTSANGDLIWFLSAKVPLRDANGEITGLIGINRDVTELKQAQVRLEAERNLLRTVIDNIPDQIYLKDCEHRFLMVNAATQNWWSNQCDLIGKTDADLPSSDTEDNFAEEKQVFLTGEMVVNREADGLTDAGQPANILITKVPLHDVEGEITGLVGINRDVTELKQAQVRLETERNLLRTVIDNIPDQIYAKDREHRFVLTNAAVRDWWSDVGDVIGKTDTDLSPIVDAPGNSDEEDQVLATGEPVVNRELNITNADNQPVNFLITKAPLYDHDNHVIGVLGINRDVTEQLQAQIALTEERNLLRTVIDNIPDQIYAKDREHRFVLTNAAVNDWWSGQGDLLGKTDFDLPEPEARRNLAEEEQVLATGEPITDRELSGVDGAGHSLYFLMTKTPLRDVQGEITGFIGINRDITESKQAEQRRTDLTVEQERVKILRQVINDMSHDIKTPLTTLRFNLHLLKMAIEHPAKRQKHLDTMDSQITRLNTMIDDLLNMSRLEQATDVFNFEPVNVLEPLRQIVEEQQALAQRRHQQLDLDNNIELPLIQADESKLNRALTNLVSNALNYTPEGGAVRVTTRQQDDHLIIDVRDNGIGMSSEEQEYIFDRFYRADQARSTATGGTGLGLPIAQHIAEAHGGKIMVESAPGAGSTFSLWLPLAGQAAG